WNEPWARVVNALGMLDAVTPNLARYVFTHPRARAAYADWDAAADEQVAHLRAAEPRWGDDPAFAALLEDLMKVDAFTSRWSTHPVSEKQRGTKQLEHPEVGALDVAYEVLVLPEDQQRLITWRSGNDATAERFATLVREQRPVSPARLSVVVNR